MDKTVPEAALLTRIDAFLTASRMTESEFGMVAIKDHKLVVMLRGGRKLRPATRQAVLDYMFRFQRSVTAALTDEPLDGPSECGVPDLTGSPRGSNGLQSRSGGSAPNEAISDPVEDVA